MRIKLMDGLYFETGETPLLQFENGECHMDSLPIAIGNIRISEKLHDIILEWVQNTVNNRYGGKHG